MSASLLTDDLLPHPPIFQTPQTTHGMSAHRMARYSAHRGMSIPLPRQVSSLMPPTTIITRSWTPPPRPAVSTSFSSSTRSKDSISQSKPTAGQPLPAPISSTKTHASILSAQRSQRPISPHLSVYAPGIWYLGAVNRATGALLSGVFYVFGSAYLLLPYLGYDVQIGALVAAFAAWPAALKVAVKGAVAFPFVFHSLNGVRHLVWDTGAWLGNRAALVSGWAVVGLSVLGSGVLAIW